MNDTVFDNIHDKASQLRVDISVEELAAFAEEREFSPEQLSAIHEIFIYLAKQKHDAAISTLLRTSRLPVKQPKTFDNFDFSIMRGRYSDRLKALNTLAPIYACTQESCIHWAPGSWENTPCHGIRERMLPERDESLLSESF